MWDLALWSRQLQLFPVHCQVTLPELLLTSPHAKQAHGLPTECAAALHDEPGSIAASSGGQSLQPSLLVPDFHSGALLTSRPPNGRRALLLMAASDKSAANVAFHVAAVVCLWSQVSVSYSAD